MTWWGAKAWVSYLTTITPHYGQIEWFWQLPITVDSDSSMDGAPESSQLAQLYYNELGGVAGSSISTTHNSSYSLFTNMQAGPYWSGTEFSNDTSSAWFFDMLNGGQYIADKTEFNYVLPLAAEIWMFSPIPSSVWLFGSALLGLLGIVRQRAWMSG